MIVKYIKSHTKSIVLFILCTLTFAMVFSLYDLPLEAVFYSFLLYFILSAFFIVFDFLKYCKRHKTLDNLMNNINLSIDNFPEPSYLFESEYQDLIKAVYNDKMNTISKYDNEKSALIDYYTLWAHQIKTPIAAMRLLLQVDNLSVKDLNLELFKIEQYVEMVLQYLRLNSDSTDFVIKKYDLNKIVKQAVRKYSKVFIGKKLSLDFKYFNCDVITDEKWLVFVIEQILSNSLKYTHFGKISIYLKEPKTLVIEDTGIGIAKEDLPRICEKGFTGYNGRLDKKSTGIGLYLSKSILKKLSHSIEIESTVGVGTKVFINLDTYDLKPD